MDQELFTNKILINSGKDKIYNLLANPKYLLDWVPEIINVEKNGQEYIIHRSESLNKLETLLVQTSEQEIIYNGKNESFQYKLFFSLENQNNKTLIIEKFTILKIHTILPISLIKPIIKNNFQQNLQNLAHLIDNLEV